MVCVEREIGLMLLRHSVSYAAVVAAAVQRTTLTRERLLRPTRYDTKVENGCHGDLEEITYCTRHIASSGLRVASSLARPRVWLTLDKMPVASIGSTVITIFQYLVGHVKDYHIYHHDIKRENTLVSETSPMYQQPFRPLFS